MQPLMHPNLGRARPARRVPLAHRGGSLATLVLALLVLLGAPAQAAVDAGADGMPGLKPQLVLPDDLQPLDLAGSAVALEGDLLAVGAAAADGLHSGQGRVWIFERQPDGEWLLVQTLEAPDPTFLGGFGQSLCLDADTLLVGSAGAKLSGVESGAAYVYRAVGNQFALEASLTPADPEVLQLFGFDVDLQADTAVISAIFAAGAVPDAGALYTYERTGSSWIQTSRLHADDAINAQQLGFGVALDADTIVAGAFSDDTNGQATGAAYVFERGPIGWAQSARLDAPQPQPFGHFGVDVDLLGDVVVVGAPGSGGASSPPGQVFVFERGSGTWSVAKVLGSPHGAGPDSFGRSVALGEGVLLAAALDADASGAGQMGRVHVFSGAPGSLAAAGSLLHATPSQYDNLGHDLAFDGSSLAAGAPGDDTLGSQAGAVAVFEQLVGAPPWTDVGHALAGSAGQPLLVGDVLGGGPLEPGATATLGLSGARALASTLWIMGLHECNAPFRGGTLVPTPDVITFGPLTDASGSLLIATPWPAIPALSRLAWQVWIYDQAAPANWAASNGLVSASQ